MSLHWYRHDQNAVVDALKRGERPDMATTMSAGPLDELVALHDELGVFDALDDMPTTRRRRGIEDVLLLRTVDPANPEDKPWTLVSTRAWPTAEAAFQAYRPPWHIENDAYRELKEGWRLKRELWGRNPAVQLARVTLTCLAFNTGQVYLSERGERLAARGIRRLRRHHRSCVGASPAVIYIGACYAVLPVEDLVAILGFPTRQSLRPAAAHPP